MRRIGLARPFKEKCARFSVNECQSAHGYGAHRGNIQLIPRGPWRSRVFIGLQIVESMARIRRGQFCGMHYSTSIFLDG